MTHLELLNTDEYRRWNKALARDNYEMKIHLDHLRAWWRKMCLAFEDEDHTISAGQIPVDENAVFERRDRVPTETLILFAEQINRLSNSHDLPEPFDIKDRPQEEA